MIRLKVAILVSAAGLLVGSLAVPTASALTGCCKQRDSVDSPWQRTNVNFATCEKLNQEKDGDREKDRDAVYENRGLVWWDAACGE